MVWRPTPGGSQATAEDALFGDFTDFLVQEGTEVTVTSTNTLLVAENTDRAFLYVQHLSGNPVKVGTQNLTFSTGLVQLEQTDAYFVYPPYVPVGAYYAITGTGTATVLVSEILKQEGFGLGSFGVGPFGGNE